MIRLSMFSYLSLVVLLSVSSSAQVTLHPNDDVSRIVNSRPEGTTFIFTPGLYRLTQPIHPKNNDRFIGETECAPPASPCPAVLSGSIVVGPLAALDGSNYQVTKQRQHNPRGATPTNCDPGWTACILPEDLYFDNVPLKHLDASSQPSIGPGEWWLDYNNHVLYFHDDPSGHTVETSVVNNAFGGPGNHVTLQYLTIEKFADIYPVGAIGETQHENVTSQQTDWTIDHCEVRLNHGFGVRINYRMHILNNYIHDNGENGVGGGLGWKSNPMTEAMNSGVVIQGNTITHNDYAHFNSQFGSGGIKVGSTSGVTIRGNIIQNNQGSGIHFDDDSGNQFVDGNLITDNSDADGLQQEIGGGISTFRNNIVLRNGAQLNGTNWAYQIAVRAGAGVDIYCNVLEVPNGHGVNAWTIGGSARGSSPYPPYQYRAAVENSFHHNTVIWEPGAIGDAGMRQSDPGHQPNFFGSNAPPDFNQYHTSGNASVFVYDNDNSHSNRTKDFRSHQRSGADAHSTVDTNNGSGFPTVAITSPADQSSVGSPATISAKAEDKSGIRKVEFYVDWKLQTTLNNPPYDFNWTNGTSGSHIVAAMAYSNAGIRNCYAITLNQQ